MRTRDDHSTDRARVLWTIGLAIAFPAVLLAVGTIRPELAVVLIPLAFAAMYVFNLRRNRKTREGTDERAVELHRRATDFAFQASTAVLGAVALWMFYRDSASAEAYIAAASVLLGSYAAAILWLRWRG